MALFQQTIAASSVAFARSFGAMATAPAMKKTEYVVYLDEQSLSTEQKAKLCGSTPSVQPPQVASRPKHSSGSKIPSVREEVVFNFGASFRTYMKKNEEIRLNVTQKKSRSADPFEGIPFRGLAEYLGGSYMEALEESRKQQQNAQKSQEATAEATLSSETPVVPHFLPITSMFAKTQAFKSTFVVDDDKSKRRTRLSWYNPQDGMVPSNWLKDGLMADLQWYRPFHEGNGWQQKQ